MSFELLCLVVLAYLVFGPRKLPEMARFFAKTMAEIRRAGNEFRYSLEDEIRKIEVEAKAPIKQLEPAPGVAGAVARPDQSASAAATDADPADADQWYESDEDWEQDAEAGELGSEAPPDTVPEVMPEVVAAAPNPPPVEAAWKRHEQSEQREQSGRPLPPVEARPQATSGSDQASSGEPPLQEPAAFEPEKAPVHAPR